MDPRTCRLEILKTEMLKQPKRDLELDQLLEAARKLGEMTPEEKRQQRISFAYGNVSMSNPSITREDVEQAAKDLEEQVSLPRRSCV